MLKGGKPGILQTYHHVGAVITIWAAVITKSPCCWVFVIFNSLIHAFMYTYYCLTTLGYRPSWKIIMTLMQITQFFGGIFISFYYLNTPNTHTPAQVFRECEREGGGGVGVYERDREKRELYRDLPT